MSTQDDPPDSDRTAPPDFDRTAPTAPGRTPAAAATRDPGMSFLDTEYSLSGPANDKAVDTLPELEDATVDDSEPGEELLASSERFRDLGRIGIGGMGEVRLVNDSVLLRNVAMKSLHPQLAQRAEHTQRFMREVRITGRLDHPHIVPVHDVGYHAEGNAFFVMKHVDGETLSARIARTFDKPLVGAVLEDFLRIFLKLTDAMGFCHSRGIIHRDLKPSNIMVGSHGEVYVMDWGIACAADMDTPPVDDNDNDDNDNDDDDDDDEDTDADEHGVGAAGTNTARDLIVPTGPPEFDGALIGTVGYMSPEQADGRVTDVDFRTDVFGMGAVLYEILTGRAPYAAEHSAIQLKNAKRGLVEDPTQVAKGRQLPPGLCRIALKAMAKNPDERYQSVGELEAAVDSFLRGGGWFETRSVAVGTAIVTQGHEADAAYIIEAGTCEVRKQIDDNQHEVLRVMGPGEVFGETAIFTNKPRTATVVALEPVDLVVITRESLDYELGGGWLATFVRSLAERFCDVDRRLSERDERPGDA